MAPEEVDHAWNFAPTWAPSARRLRFSRETRFPMAPSFVQIRVFRADADLRATLPLDFRPLPRGPPIDSLMAPRRVDQIWIQTGQIWPEFGRCVADFNRRRTTILRAGAPWDRRGLWRSPWDMAWRGLGPVGAVLVRALLENGLPRPRSLR